MIIPNPTGAIDEDGRPSNDEYERPVDAREVRSQANHDGSGDALGEHAFLPSLLSGDASGQAEARWQRVQAQFVDDPRRSVSEAHELVSDLMRQIVDAFSAERDGLESQWSRGDAVSTEDLRLCLQRYRDFFGRLLPSVERT